MCFELSDSDKWCLIDKKVYNTFKLNKILSYKYNEIELDNIMNNIHDLFCDAVKKRVENSYLPIACLLSGGLDSSIVRS